MPTHHRYEPFTPFEPLANLTGQLDKLKYRKKTLPANMQNTGPLTEPVFLYFLFL